MASSAAIGDAATDANPFTLHAQGTSAGADARTMVSPAGNGLLFSRQIAAVATTVPLTRRWR